MEILRFFQSLPAYFVMGALGFILALVLVIDSMRTSDYTKKDKIKIAIAGLISFLIGVMLSNVANWFLFTRENSYTVWELIKLAGFTFYFGIIGFFLVAAPVYAVMKYDLKKLFYYITPAIPLFHGVARVGCALTGCCYGIEVNWNIFGVQIQRFPTQFLESLFLFILFYILQYKVQKGRTVIYFMSYAVFRFIIEFFRGDDRGTLIQGIPLSVSQQVAVMILIVCSAYLVYNYFTKKKISVAERNGQTDNENK